MTVTSPQRPHDVVTTSTIVRRGWVVAIVALLLVISTAPVIAAADLPGESQGTLAAVFSPGADKAAIMAAVAEARGTVVRGGGWGSVLVVHSDEGGFARRLRQAGAWFVVDPQSAAGCLITDATQTS